METEDNRPADTTSATIPRVHLGTPQSRRARFAVFRLESLKHPLAGSQCWDQGAMSYVCENERQNCLFGQVKTLQKSVFPEIQLFFVKRKGSPNYCKPLANFQRLKTWLSQFLPVSLSFVKERISIGPCSTSPVPSFN